MTGVFDHLHIKRNTAGSSNELSFDVLDAARNELDGKKPLSSKLVGATVGTTKRPAPSEAKPAANKPKPAANKPAKKEREEKRKGNNSRRVLISGAAVALLAVAAVAVYLCLSFVESKTSFNDQMNACVAATAPIDEALKAADELMETSPLDADANLRAQWPALCQAARTCVESTRAEMERLQPHVVTTQQGIALQQLDQIVSMKEIMLTATDQAVEVADKAADQAAQFAAVWSTVLDADQLAREATVQANAAETEKAIGEAKESTEVVLARMRSAQEQLAELAKRFSDVDASAQAAYLQKRIEALQHAVATSGALLAGDRVTAQEENDAYNVADEAAAAMASELPVSFDETVHAVVADDIQELCEKYQAAGAQVDELETALSEHFEP